MALSASQRRWRWLATAKITANAICPGYVLTPLVEAQIPDQMKAYDMDRETVIREVMLDKQPTKEFVTTGQIGALAVFATDAAAQINGTSCRRWRLDRWIAHPKSGSRFWIRCVS